MATTINTNLTYAADYKIGGISELYYTNRSEYIDIDLTASKTHTLDGLNGIGGATVSFNSIKIKPNTCFYETVKTERNAANNYFTTNLTFEISGQTDETLKFVYDAGLEDTRLTFILKNRFGKYIVLGTNEGLGSGVITERSGTTEADSASTIVTFAGEEIINTLILDSTKTMVASGSNFTIGDIV